MEQYTRPATLDDLKALVQSLNEKTKQTLRDKDVSDRIVLERALETYRQTQS